MYETSGFGLDVVVRGCGLKRSCGNTLKGSELARTFEKLHVTVLRSIEYPSIEVKCCDTDYCNVCSLLKGKSIVFCVFLVSFVL